MSAKRDAPQFNHLVSQMTRENLKVLQRLASSRMVFEVYVFYLENPGTHSCQEVMKEMKLPEPTVYYAIKRLRKMGLIKVAKKERVKGIRGGPTPGHYIIVL